MSNSNGLQVDEHVIDVATRALRGEIDLQEATRLLHLPAVQGIDLAKSQKLAAEVSRRASQGDWRSTVVLAHLCWELAKAQADLCSDREAVHPLMLAYLRGVSSVLGPSPQFALYVQARYVASQLLRDARRLKLPLLASFTHTEIGHLHLRPLRSQQTHPNASQDAAIAQWYEQGAQTHSAFAGKTFPDLVQAFWIASEAFRRSRRGLDGRQLGQALVSQITALEQRQRLLPRPDIADLTEMIAEAQHLLNPLHDIGDLTYLMGLEQEATGNLNHSVLQALIVLPLDQFVAAVGPQVTLTAHLNLSKLVSPYSRSDALSVTTKAEPVLSAVHSETLRARYYKARLTALAQARGHDFPDMSDGFTTHLQVLKRQADKEDWPIEHLVSAIFAAIVASSDQNCEGDGLASLHELKAHGFFDAYIEHHGDTFSFLRMVLSAGAGVNASQAQRSDDAFIHYADAVKRALRLQFAEFASTYTRYLTELLPTVSYDKLDNVLVILFDLGLELEVGLGLRGADPIRHMVRDLTTAAFSDGSMLANSNLLHMVWQLAKSRRFGAAVRHRAARAIDSALFDHPVLEDIGKLRRRVTVSEELAASGDAAYRSWRLLSFVREVPPSGGSSDAERLVNLQHYYDQALERELAARSVVSEAQLYTLSDIQRDLDERTVLLQLFIGRFEHKRAMAVLLTSRHGTTFYITPDKEEADVEFEVQGFSESGYSYLEDVMYTRSVGWSEYTQEQHEAMLDAAGGAFMHGPAGNELLRLNGLGADHLVIVPHGPFHLAPLQLLMYQGRKLCDDWIVTSLPSIELMRRARDGKTAHSNNQEGVSDATGVDTDETMTSERTGAAVFGVGFLEPNAHGMAPLEYAEKEARLVAKKLGVTAYLGADATEENLLNSLSTARYVHIATHGVFNLDAPSFHYLALTPGAQSDGRLHAHELLRLNLTGVSIVTLSACETALSKHDRLDNPRGIAASLLLAGAETIVATLWSISDDASCAFFVEFYREIAKQRSKRDAFRYAQNEVRRRFPALKDWGAFYLLGSWD